MTSLHSPSVHPPSAPLSPSTVSSCPPSPPLESLSDSFGGVKAKLDHLESTIGSTLNISKKQKNFTPFKTRHMSSQQQYGQQYQQQDSDSDVSSLNDSVVITPPRSQTHATHSPRPKRSSALKQRSLNTPTKSLSKTSMKKLSSPSLKKKTFVTTTTTTPLKPPQNLVDQLTQSRQHAQTLQSSVTSSRLQLSSEKNLRLKLERSLTTSKIFNERLEEEVERLKREQEECREEIERKDLKLKEVGREVEVLKEEFDYFKLKYSSGEEKNLKYDLEKKEIDLNQLQEELKVEKEKQIKIEKELEGFKEKEREEKGEKERIERRVEEERERERKERERAEGEVRRLKEKLDENESNVKRDVRKWEKEVEAERRKRDRIEGKCEEIRRGIEEEKKNANNLKSKLREVKAENNELKSTTNTSSSELANLHRTIRRLEEEKERTEREREEERGAREEVERKVERLRKEGEERKEIEEENARLKSCILALQTSTTSLNKTYLSERTQRLQLQEQLIHNTSKFKQAMSFFSKELEEVGREQLKIVEREQQVRNINEGVREDIEALKAKRNIERRASELKVEAERLERNPMGRIGERDLEFKAIKASIEEGGRDIHGAFHEGPVGEGARLSPDLGDRDLKLREPIVKPIPTPTTVAVKPPAASSEIGDLKEAIESVKSHLESLTKSANNNSTSSEISKLRRELIEESRSKEVEGLRRMVEGVVEKVEDLKRGNGEVLKEGLEEVLKKFAGIGRR
ncbi:hypothetical protein TL16_g02412 [Triparma laevis f. inornata]|uniref:Uncharacterized protein n=1 Tax=Triparma laevis f. inornata TaxID=1714386 RepID=A0A9W6ZX80_9STRA|nr:hypothetical protein TL16_g02412 [Triparma laevis f. inornata]